MFLKEMTPLEKAVDEGMFPQLETFPAPPGWHDKGNGVIRIVFPEFTCVCPRTGYPDFATIGLHYLPDKLCLELKSWKLYLNSFRMIGTFHETVTAHLFKTLTETLHARWLLVTGDFLPRGNVDTTVVFESEGERPKSAQFLLGSLALRSSDLQDHCPGESQ